MGLSASQARFLELTARKSNIEYQAQQINFERTQLATYLTNASLKYNEKMSNQKLIFSYNDGTGGNAVDITYNNYKNYMNQQMKGLNSASQQLFLISSSGKKIVVSNEQEIQDMMAKNMDGGKSKFKESDFIIAPDLDDVDNFQQAIRDGVYFFGTYSKDEETGEARFSTYSWDTVQSGAIKETYDVSDDKVAEAEYNRIESEVQLKDKKLALELDRLESEREEIQTELEAVQKVIDDNVEAGFKVFS